MRSGSMRCRAWRVVFAPADRHPVRPLAPLLCRRRLDPDYPDPRARDAQAMRERQAAGWLTRRPRLSLILGSSPSRRSAAQACCRWRAAFLARPYPTSSTRSTFRLARWRDRPVTDFFDYVLVWNTGISYGLLGSVPVWAVLGVADRRGAHRALTVWWFKALHLALVAVGLAFCIGGALSNALDRVLYGAVADFFHFHWQDWSFYIFNLADAVITARSVAADPRSDWESAGPGRPMPA